MAWYDYFRKAKAYEAKYKEDPELHRFKKEVAEASGPLARTLDSLLYTSSKLVEDLDDAEQAASSLTSPASTLQALSSSQFDLGRIGPGYSTLAGPLPPPDPNNPFESSEYLQTRPSSRFNTIKRRRDKQAVKDDDAEGEEVNDDDEVSAQGEPFDGSSNSVFKYEQILTPSSDAYGYGST